MKDYKNELDRYEYDKRYKLPKEHKWDSLKEFNVTWIII